MNNYTAFALALTIIPQPSTAQEVQVAPDRYAVTLRRADLGSVTPVQAQHSLSRIDRAAMAACGASGFSLREVKVAVRKSSCWHDSVEDALRQIKDPLLWEVWRDHR